MYQEKKEEVVCPHCKRKSIMTSTGDLNSGWSGAHWGDGEYSEGVISWSVDCDCGFHYDDVEVND